MNEPRTFIEPLGGLIIDELSKIRNIPFVPHSLTKLRNILYCRKKTHSKTAIEIGTYKGVTTRRLARYFEKVISVEIEESLYKKSQRRLAGLKNVELLLGDGTKLLPSITERVDSAIIFLDGHFSGGETGHGSEPEPVLVEIDLIKKDIDRINAIIVDDFRLFGVEPGWPKKYEVIEKLESTLPAKDWDHHIMNDQFVCVRKNSRVHD
jgi:hypothetical protein